MKEKSLPRSVASEKVKQFDCNRFNYKVPT